MTIWFSASKMKLVSDFGEIWGNYLLTSWQLCKNSNIASPNSGRSQDSGNFLKIEIHLLSDKMASSSFSSIQPRKALTDTSQTDIFDWKIDNFVEVCRPKASLTAILGGTGFELKITCLGTHPTWYLYILTPQRQPLSVRSISLVKDDDQELPFTKAIEDESSMREFVNRRQTVEWSTNGQLHIRCRIETPREVDKPVVQPTLSQDLGKEDLGYSDFTLVIKRQIMIFNNIPIAESLLDPEN